MKPRCILVGLLLLSAVAAAGCSKPEVRRSELGVLPSARGGHNAAPAQQSKNECCVDYRDALADIRLHRNKVKELERAGIQDEKLFKPIGQFERIIPSGWPGADFVALRDGTRWRVEIVVGAEPAGIATKADCRMILIGHMKNGQLVVRPDREASSAHGYVMNNVVQTILVNGNSARILDNNSSAYCDGPYYAKGTYKKSRTIGDRWTLEN